MLKNPDNLADLDLNLLYTFRTFVESGTLHQTAAKLGRSQPTISARLHQLERELGMTLLQRKGRQLQLTPFGRGVDKQLHAIFSGVRELANHVRASQGSTGVLRVGALHTVGVFVLAPRIPEFCAERPGADVELHYGLARDQLDAMQDGLLDLVAGIGNPPHTGFNVMTIGQARPVLVVQKGTKRLPRGPIGPQHLASIDLIGYGPIDDPFFGAVWEFFECHGLDNRLRVMVNHIETLKALVAAGAGVAILPDYTVVEPGLEIRRVEGLEFSLPIWMAARSSSLAIPLLSNFWTFVQAYDGRDR